MRSVRFDPDLEARVERAAKKRGVTVSDFIRTAVRRECDDALVGEPKEDWKAILAGSPNGEEWIKLLDGFAGSIHGDGSSLDERMDEWSQTIREHNWRQ